MRGQFHCIYNLMCFTGHSETLKYFLLIFKNEILHTLLFYFKDCCTVRSGLVVSMAEFGCETS